MVIEAKKLGSGLQDCARQAVDYAMDARRQARYFAITDGQSWEIYDTNRPAREMNLVSFVINTASTAEVCLKAMALWRPAVEQGHVKMAETPIAGLYAIKPDATEPVDLLTPERELMPQVQHATKRPPASVSQSGETGQEWVPLSDLSPQGGDNPPVEIQFPDNSKVVLGRWNLVVVESTRWLYENNYLNATNWRIQRATRYLVSDAPIHPNGKEFTMPSNIGGSLYVEINYSGLNHVRNAQIIIEHADQDPAQFKVRLSS